jgi:hypothetical protein
MNVVLKRNWFVRNEVYKQYEATVGSKFEDYRYWCDSSCHSKFKYNGKKSEKKCSDTVTMGNGKSEATE